MNGMQVAVGREIYSRFRGLSEHDAAQVMRYIDTLESSHEPNELTLAALREADSISRDPNVKSYTNIDEMVKDILKR